MIRPLFRIMLPLVATAVVVAGRPAAADVVVMEDGRILRGEVVRETRFRIVLRSQVNGTWTDLEIERRDIDQVYDEAGHQADDASKPGTTPRVAEPPRRAEPDTAVPRRGDRGGPLVVVVPLRGQVGGLLDGSVTGTFDAEVLALCLDQAAADGADAVVLDIDSPGGYLVEMDDICALILERGADLRIVAWPREALSAAAIMTLTCREMVVRPGARIGAAVMIQRGADGDVDAVEAKVASPHHARQRQYMERSGRPPELLAAMSILERELWWSPQRGFLDSTEAAADALDARRVDGPATVLTMTANDALTWGVASGRVSDPVGLPEALGLEPGTTRVVVYDDLVRQHNGEVNRRLGVVLQQFGAYFQGLGGIEVALGELAQAKARGDRDTQRRLEKDLGRLVSRTRTAAKAIQGQDRRLLARRTDLPEGMMDQLDRDGDVLAAVGRVTRGGDATALPRARRNVQEILERWRALLTF